MMLLQVFTVYGAPVAVPDTTPGTTPVVGDQPTEVGANFKQLPVYYNGNDIVEFDKFMRKYNNTDADVNKQFDVSGTVRFRVRSYAYGTGENLKVGTCIEVKDKNRQWVRVDWKGNETVFSKQKVQDFMDGKIQLSISIDDINFAVPNTDKDNLRVKFDMQTQDAEIFDTTTTDSIKFMTDGKVGITRTLKEVPNEKNVWEVEIKLEGQLKPEVPPTEIVFALDRSGSMKDPVGSQTRAKLVESASKYLVGELVKQKDLKVSVLSFGGTTRSPGGAGYEHFDNNWNSINQIRPNGGWYSNYIVETDFTDDVARLNSAVTSAMTNINGGTPIATAIIKSGLLLQNSTAKNRVIILLSDGAPTYARDGSGTGGSSPPSILNDTVLAATQAKSKVNNLKIFTIAAGSGISTSGKDVLEKCATSVTDAYVADDTQTALKGVMNSILAKVEEGVGSKTILTETLSDNVSLEEAVGGTGMKVTTIGFKDKEKGITDDVDWNNTTIAITQGSITKQLGQDMAWDIGNLTTSAPAIMKFRIKLRNGLLGKKYDVSKNAQFKYTDTTGREVINGVPNGRVKFSWAEIDMSTYDYATMSTVPGSQFKIWHKVPSSFRDGDVKISYDTAYNSATNEVEAGGNKTIRDSLVIPPRADGNPATIMGALVDNNMYTYAQINDPSKGAKITQSPAEGITLVNEPDISSIMNKGVNFIQPQGVSNVTASVKFKVKSKDVSYTVDLSRLVDAKLAGKTLMSYDFTKYNVRVTKVNEGDKVLVQGTDYTLENLGDRQIKVNFNGFIEAADDFKIAVYIPCALNEEVIYGGSATDTYLKQYRNKIVGVDNVIMASPKVGDTTVAGVTEEVYGTPVITNSMLKPENKINVIYIDIATIN